MIDSTSDVIWSDNTNNRLDLFADGGWRTCDCKTNILNDSMKPLDTFGVQVGGTNIGVYRVCDRRRLRFSGTVDCNTKYAQDDTGNEMFIIEHKDFYTIYKG